MIEIYLAFMAFILAFFALIKQITTFRLNIGLLSTKVLLWFFIITGGVALTSILISHHTIDALKYAYTFFNNLYASPSYQVILAKIYQILNKIPYSIIGRIIYFIWNLGLVSIIIYLFYNYITPSKFSNQNAKVYLNECNLIIASGVQQDIQQLVSEVSYSIPIIFETAASQNDTISEYAHGLIALFSDELFCKSIVNHNPTMLYAIFEDVIKNCNRYDKLGINFISRLISLLFTESSSILHREEPFYGLGIFGTFKKLIFGNVCYFK